MKKDEFIQEIKKLNIKYDEEMLEKLDTYCDYLLEYNMHTNLTAIRDKEGVFLKHFYDSLTIVNSVDMDKINNFLDIGSGAGFPGIVLKIFFPHLHGTLIDSNNKKTTFLQKIIQKLDLDNMMVVNDRVENFSKNNLNFFDLVTARAVSNMSVLSELALPLVKINGLFVAMKGKDFLEVEEAYPVIEKMGGNVIDISKFNLYKEEGERTLIKVEKVRQTSLNELRSYEKIVKSYQKKHNK